MEEKDLTAQRFVAELDKYIISQKDAKRKVAIAFRSRWRRRQLEPEIQQDIIPKNIIMMGPTGVGKTEIARRIAKLTNAPFVKVDATSFTEVGYMGRDVTTIVKDLMARALRLVEEEKISEVDSRALEAAKDRVLKILVTQDSEYDPQDSFKTEQITASLRQEMEKTEIQNKEIEITITILPDLNFGDMEGVVPEELQNMLAQKVPVQKQIRKVTVAQAIELFKQEEQQKMLSHVDVVEEARARVEETGIVFIDEFDKIAHREQEGSGPGVSREGVQRDLLPIVEGTSINTRYGPIRTDHILFISAGAFHTSKPQDLIPELQGRFPIRVRLHSLTREDLIRILTEPENALLKQYQYLIEVDKVKLKFTPDAIDEIAKIAETANEKYLDIGARRLYTVMERLLEDISYRAPEDVPEENYEITIDRETVVMALANAMDDDDLSSYSI